MAQKPSSDSPLGLGLDEMMKVNAHNMEALAKSYGSFFERVGKINGETLNFCVERWKEEFEMPTKIAQCHAPEEIAEAYTNFYSKMFSDYNEQARRVMDLVGEVSKEGFPSSQIGQSKENAK